MLYKQIQKITKIKSVIKTVAAISAVSLVLAVTLASGITPQKALADEAGCTASGGQWLPNDRSGALTCSNCPANTISDGQICVSPTTDNSISEPTAKVNDCSDSSGVLDRDNCGIVRYIVLFINVLSIIVGVVVTAVIIWGGIEYSTAGGDPSKIQSAKKRVYNGITSLVAFIFTYAFLQYIVPGGLF